MELIFIISMIVFAVHYTMQEGEIFGAFQKIPLGKMSDPFRDCPVCMVPYYGSIAYWFIGDRDLIQWAITIIASLGLNAVLVKLFPDKETPGIHQELTEINESITDVAQVIKPVAEEVATIMAARQIVRIHADAEELKRKLGKRK